MLRRGPDERAVERPELLSDDAVRADRCPVARPDSLDAAVGESERGAEPVSDGGSELGADVLAIGATHARAFRGPNSLAAANDVRAERAPRAAADARTLRDADVRPDLLHGEADERPNVDSDGRPDECADEHAGADAGSDVLPDDVRPDVYPDVQSDAVAIARADQVHASHGDPHVR